MSSDWHEIFCNSEWVEYVKPNKNGTWSLASDSLMGEFERLEESFEARELIDNLLASDSEEKAVRLRLDGLKEAASKADDKHMISLLDDPWSHPEDNEPLVIHRIIKKEEKGIPPLGKSKKTFYKVESSLGLGYLSGLSGGDVFSFYKGSSIYNRTQIIPTTPELINLIEEFEKGA